MTTKETAGCLTFFGLLLCSLAAFSFGFRIGVGVTAFLFLLLGSGYREDKS